MNNGESSNTIRLTQHIVLKLKLISISLILPQFNTNNQTPRHRKSLMPKLSHRKNADIDSTTRRLRSYGQVIWVTCQLMGQAAIFQMAHKRVERREGGVAKVTS